MSGVGTGGRALLRALSVLVALIGAAQILQAAYIPVKAQAAQALLDRAFARSLAEARPVKPWPWADALPAARIVAPRLGVNDVVLSGGSGQAMAFGPTALPSPRREITVLAAHRDTHFTFVRDLRVGDLVRLDHVDGRRDTYRVSGFQTVRWDRFAVPSDPARPLLALATCYPFGATTPGPLRRVAWAERVSPADAGEPAVSRN